jgi:UDPglucose--hexose-1-phosphate uridylyltransferase
VSTPRHARSFADLDDAELACVAAAWRARAETARHEGFAYVHAFLNEGREAGASLAHSHTQLVWLRELPAAVEKEHTSAGDCGVCELLTRDDLLVEERVGVAALAHPAGRLPYELLIAPRAHDEQGFAGEQLPVALQLLAGAVRRVRALEGPVPLNAWLHAAGHWHVEVVPRVSILAGVELGAEIYVNALPPEDAAAALKEAVG